MVEPLVEIIEITPKAAILLISGQMDAASCEGMHRQISAIHTEHHPRSIILDVSLVEYICSAGISLLTRLAQELASGGGRLVFVGLQDWIRHSIDMLGYTSYFDYWDSMYTASQALAAD